MTGGDILLALAFGLIAILYAAVGQAGGTGYIAVMGLAGLAPDIIKPTALALNIVVACIGTVRFARAGLLRWPMIAPFALLGLPLSAVGGAIHLAPALYQPLVGALLLAASLQMLLLARARPRPDPDSAPPFGRAALLGGVIGLVSGITGLGGGIFLAPLLLGLRWASPLRTAAISAAYNLLNSTAALATAATTLSILPTALPLWMLAVALGGLAGSWLGLRHLPAGTLRLILASLLLLAGLRMLLA